MVLFKQAVYPLEFRPQVLTSLLWVVVLMSVHFSESLESYSDLSGTCAAQWPIWRLDSDLSCRSVPKVCIFCLG